MHSTIEKFYNSFKNLDGDAMAACYHDDVVFEDPAFGVLKGDKAKNMWRMLCKSQKGKDFSVKISDIKEDNVSGKVHWEANYNFGKKGRRVHNIIEAKFELKDGLIIKHIDSFNLYTWAKQALGFSGLLIGWTSFFKNKLNAQTNHLLSKFEQNL